jgi:hypothetical protein
MVACNFPRNPYHSRHSGHRSPISPKCNRVTAEAPVARKEAKKPRRQDTRYWRILLPAAADIQDGKNMSLSQRLRGLQGMSFGAGSVLGIGQTASRLSLLGQPVDAHADDATEPSRRATSNSNTMYPYLRGERCPVEGPRGKRGVDLTGAVYAQPGGETARRWMDSLLWDVLDSTISRERLEAVRLQLESMPPNAFLRGYIEIWIRYRFLTFARCNRAKRQEIAQTLDAYHATLRIDEPVFNYLFLPLLRYLELAEPDLPLAWYGYSVPIGASKMYARLLLAFQKSSVRSDQCQNEKNRRFQSGVDRFQRSGGLHRPDHRFLSTFREEWRQEMEISEESQVPDSGPGALCHVWNREFFGLPSCT